MNSNSYLLLQSIFETDQELSIWTNRLAHDSFFELGSDPVLIGEMEQGLERLSRQLDHLNGHFDIEQVPVRQANSYYAAASELENAVSLIKEIRQSDYGSTQNTQRFLQQLESCQHNLREMSYMLQANPSNLKH